MLFRPFARPFLGRRPGGAPGQTASSGGVARRVGMARILEARWNPSDAAVRRSPSSSVRSRSAAATLDSSCSTFRAPGITMVLGRRRIQVRVPGRDGRRGPR